MQFKELKTERLVLKKVKYSDIDNYMELHSSKDNFPISDFEVITDRKRARELLKFYIEQNKKGETLHWSVYTRQGEFVGYISFWNINKEEKSGERGALILPKHRGKKYYRELGKVIIDFAILSGFDIVRSATTSDNIGVVKTNERIGMKIVGRYDKKAYYSDKIMHYVLYEIRKEDNEIKYY